MAVFVDDLVTYPDSMLSSRVKRAGKSWCHLMADTPEELHGFAARLGLSRTWAQHVGKPTEHYDLVPSKRAAAVRLGAHEVTRREMAQRVASRLPVPTNAPPGNQP